MALPGKFGPFLRFDLRQNLHHAPPLQTLLTRKLSMRWRMRRKLLGQYGLKIGVESVIDICRLPAIGVEAPRKVGSSGIRMAHGFLGGHRGMPEARHSRPSQ